MNLVTTKASAKARSREESAKDETNQPRMDADERGSGESGQKEKTIHSSPDPRSSASSAAVPFRLLRAPFAPSRLRARLRPDVRRRGFTLVEVLATIVLMAIVLPVAMHGVSLCLASAQAARQRTEAAGLAEAKLGELLATGDWQYGLLSGDFGEAWPEYKWSGGAAAWDDAALRELSVRVYWTSRGSEREVIVTTLVFESQETATEEMGF